MYRYSIDNVLTYTSEDFILFKESPFASWMERLTIENPDHGILPDLSGEHVRAGMSPFYGSAELLNVSGRTVEPVEWDEFVHVRHALSASKPNTRSHMTDAYTASSGDVTVVQWHMSEPQRRAETLEAMQRGAQFIVNGQLSMGPLSGSVNLLIRSGGISELGDYFYIPCGTLSGPTLHDTFRLSFLADLLHCIQGVLPPQMLIMREGTEVRSLQTEDHIAHFRNVKYLFMTAQLSFRKHSMPDPAESSHFGRWSGCAYDLLKRQAVMQGCEVSGAAVTEPVSAGPAAQAHYAVPAEKSPDIGDVDADEGDISSTHVWSEAPSPKLRSLTGADTNTPMAKNSSSFRTPAVDKTDVLQGGSGGSYSESGSSMIDRDAPEPEAYVASTVHLELNSHCKPITAYTPTYPGGVGSAGARRKKSLSHALESAVMVGGGS